MVICLKIKVNAVFLSWILLKKSTGNSQGLIRLSNMVVYQMKKLQNVSNSKISPSYGWKINLKAHWRGLNYIFTPKEGER